jgi:hypothetical protein
MQSYSRDRARRALAAIAVCIAAVGLTAMPAFAKSSGLTKKQVITLIKKYAKPGPAGPSGSKGSTGNTGPMGNPGPTYAAGTGLTLSGSTFSVAPTIFQQRVSTTCPGDESMYGIEQNGTPMCAVGTDADSNDNISADETIVSDSSPTTLDTITVGAADYFVTADAGLYGYGAGGAYAACRIVDGSDVIASAIVEVDPGEQVTVSIQGYQESTAVSNDELHCEANAHDQIENQTTSPPSSTSNLTAILLNGPGSALN